MNKWEQIFIGIQLCLSVQLLAVSVFNIMDNKQKSFLLSSFCILLLQIPIVHIFQENIIESSLMFIFFGSWKGYFYGPLLYLYIKSLNKKGGSISVMPHLIIPGILVLLGLIGYFYFDTQNAKEIFKNDISIGTILKSLGYFSYWSLIIFYFFKGIIQYKRYIKSRLRPKAKTRFFSFYLITNIHLLSTIVPGLILFLGLSTEISFIQSLNEKLITPYYEFYALPQYMILFAFLIFYGITESKWLKNIYLSENIYMADFFEDNKEVDLVLRNFFEVDKIYKNPHLTIEEFSIISQVKKSDIRNYILKSGFKSFTEYINQLRISDFIEKLKSNQDKVLTLDSLAEESGFKSRATFYRVFKKHTNMSPTQYKETLIESPTE